MRDGPGISGPHNPVGPAAVDLPNNELQNSKVVAGLQQSTVTWLKGVKPLLVTQANTRESAAFKRAYYFNR